MAVLANEGFFFDDFATEGAISFIKSKRRNAGFAIALENGLDTVSVDASGNTAKFEDGIVARVADLPINNEAVTGQRAFLADTEIWEGDVLSCGEAREQKRFFLAEEIDYGGAWNAAKFLVVLGDKDKGGAIYEAVDIVDRCGCQREATEITTNRDSGRIIDI